MALVTVMGVAFLWLAAGAVSGVRFDRARVGNGSLFGNGKNFTQILCAVNNKSSYLVD
ncbi:protein of unknown function [Magnetospirillum sp. XM-1]|nr:protein of unknown function [Magnetospirillum sp. XM-1]